MYAYFGNGVFTLDLKGMDDVEFDEMMMTIIETRVRQRKNPPSEDGGDVTAECPVCLREF